MRLVGWIIGYLLLVLVIGCTASEGSMETMPITPLGGAGGISDSQPVAGQQNPAQIPTNTPQQTGPVTAGNTTTPGHESGNTNPDTTNQVPDGPMDAGTTDDGGPVGTTSNNSPTAPDQPATEGTPIDPSQVTGGEPVIPEVTGDCPVFRPGTISFGGVSGINVNAGAKAAGPTAPMVLYWHGTVSSAPEYMGMSAAVSAGVVAEGGVLTSFQGSSGIGDSSCSGTFIFSTGDMDISDQLLACAVRDHNIDPRRIYTTGCSAGGLFSACLAARRSGYIAAAAPNSGGFVFPQPFQAPYTPALMTIHGGPSDVVGVNFTQTSATADAVFKDRGGFVINCNHGGMHCGGGGLAPQIWEFFKAHPYGVDPYPWVGGLPADFPSTCAIY